MPINMVRGPISHILCVFFCRVIYNHYQWTVFVYLLLNAYCDLYGDGVITAYA